MPVFDPGVPWLRGTATLTNGSTTVETDGVITLNEILEGDRLYARASGAVLGPFEIVGGEGDEIELREAFEGATGSYAIAIDRNPITRTGAKTLRDVADILARIGNFGELSERDQIGADLIPIGPERDAIKDALDVTKRASNLADLNNLKEARSNLGEFATVADVQSRHIPAVLESIRTEGYYNPGDGGGAQLIEGAPSDPGARQSADGKWWKVAEKIVSPEMFGILADGNSYTSRWDILFSYLSLTGSILDGNGRTYHVTDTISLPVYRASVRNITLDGSSLSGSKNVAEMICPEPELVGYLATDAAHKNRSVTLESVAGLSAGDWVLIRSEAIMGESETGDGRHSRAAELLQVQDIDANVINLRSPLIGDYHVSDEARVEKIQTAGGVDFDKVLFIGGFRGFYIEEGFRSRYRDCGARLIDQAGIEEHRCYLTNGSGVWEFEGTDTLSNSYGLNFVGCHNGHYGDVSGRRVRHLTTTGSAKTSKGRTVSRGCSVGDVTGTECYSSVVDQHPGGGLLQVGNIYATFATGADLSAGATQLQGAGANIESITCVASGAENKSGVLFDTYGFLDPDFTPTVTVGSLNISRGQQGARVWNNTNRFGTGVSQDINLSLGRCDGTADAPLYLRPTTGRIFAQIKGGVFRCKSADGLGALIGRGSDPDFPYIADFSDFYFTADAPSLTPWLTRIYSSGDRVSIRGGGLTVLGGSLPLRPSSSDGEVSIHDVMLSGVDLPQSVGYGSVIKESSFGVNGYIIYKDGFARAWRKLLAVDGNNSNEQVFTLPVQIPNARAYTAADHTITASERRTALFLATVVSIDDDGDARLRIRSDAVDNLTFNVWVIAEGFMG